jgi:hypothetical protein
VLTLAAQDGNSAAVQMLVNAKADLNAQNKEVRRQCSACVLHVGVYSSVVCVRTVGRRSCTRLTRDTLAPRRC